MRARNTGAQEAQGGLKEDDRPNLQGGQDDDSVHHVGQDVPEHDAHVGSPGDFSARHEVQLFDAQGLAAHLPGVADPEQCRDDANDGEKPRPENSDSDESHENEGHREEGVHHPHDDRVRPLAEVGRHQSKARPDCARNDDGA